MTAGGPGSLCVHSLIDEAGKPQQAGMLIPTLNNYAARIFRPKRAKYRYIGASMAMHRATFEALGGWCEAYFMYSEAPDLCYTAHKKGIDVQTVDAEITHIGKVSSAGKWTNLQRAQVIERSVRTFCRRHRTMAEYRTVRILQLIYQLFRDPASFRVGLRAFAANTKE